jgi:hypothetical protein
VRLEVIGTKKEEDEELEVDIKRSILWGEIICCLSNNQSVKCVALDAKYVVGSLWNQEFITIEKIKLLGDSDSIFPPLST